MTEHEIPPSVDPSKPVIGKPYLTATNEAKTKTVIRVRDLETLIDEPKERGGTNLAPTPLETSLASLIGCEAAVLRIVAGAIGFKYDGLEFECEGELDLRGVRGVRGIRPYFESVRLTINVTTDESEKKFKLLRRNVEQRCPVLNLFKDAGVTMHVEWRKTPRSKVS